MADAGKALSQRDADAITARYEQLMGDGMPEDDAAVQAVAAHMLSLSEEAATLSSDGSRSTPELPHFEEYERKRRQPDPAAKQKREFTYSIEPFEDGFQISSPDGGGVVLSGRPTGPAVLNNTPPRKFESEQAARDYMQKKGMQEAATAEDPPSLPDDLIENATRGYQSMSALDFTDADMDYYRAGLRGEDMPTGGDPDIEAELEMMYQDGLVHRDELIEDAGLADPAEMARRAEREAQEEREWLEEQGRKREEKIEAQQQRQQEHEEELEWRDFSLEEGYDFAANREAVIIASQRAAESQAFAEERRAYMEKLERERKEYQAARYDDTLLGRARYKIDPWLVHVNSKARKFNLPEKITKRSHKDAIREFAGPVLKEAELVQGGDPAAKLARLHAYRDAVQMLVEEAAYGRVIKEWPAERVAEVARQLHKGRGKEQIDGETTEQQMQRIRRAVYRSITPDEFEAYARAEKEKRQPAKRLKKRTKPRSADYGKKNKVFSEDQYKKDVQKLKGSFGKLKSGLDPEEMAIGIRIAGYHIEAGMHKFIDFANAMIEDLGEGVAPYLRSFYEAVRYQPDFDPSEMDSAADADAAYTELQETLDAERTAGTEEADSTDRGDEVRSPGGDLSDAERGRGGRAAPDAGAETGRDEPGSGAALDLFGTPAPGESGNPDFYSEKSELEASAPRDTDEIGSRPDSTGGLYAEREADEAPPQDLGEASPPKLTPVSGPFQSADLAQIRERMPFLYENQAKDVVFAEERFAKPDGFGVLFTNGTGTGKTYSGLGIVQRFIDQGRENILIVSPKQTIVDGFIKAAKKDFGGLHLHKLENKRDGGQGPTITSFANMQDNPELMKRDWDLILLDEAHYLSQSQSGEVTAALDRFRGMALKRGSARTRIYAIHQDKVEKMEALYTEAKRMRSSDDERQWQAEGAVTKQADALRQELSDLVEAEAERLAGIQDKQKPRAVFLSATPFAYEKTVQLGQEFLFDWGEDDPGTSRGYNAQSKYEDFMMTHFGYRMRYNKLTEPDHKVDRGLMQRAFNKWLKEQGSLSGRVLESDYDYDRHFVMTPSAIGLRVDEALEWLRGEEGDSDEMVLGKRELQDIINESFGYHQRMYFLEAIKAREALPHIQEHLDAGRKVLVMHDFKKGGTINPFKLSPDTPAAKQAYTEFKRYFNDLVYSFDALPSPIDTLSERFPGALVYNGDVSDTKRIKMQDDFNSDAESSPRLMVAQGDAMREGVSIHDTTGKSPRVLVHLGMPVKPTAAIQQEGRIYRTGQASHAMFRYFTIGTNWERFAFASKIAGRAGAAENLAMGEQARGLKEAFIQAYEDADEYSPGFEGEGTGGREADRALIEALTPWDIAKSLYFGKKKQGKGRGARGREHSEYFATPEPLGMKMVAWANLRGGDEALEPSAGHGAIGRFFPENTRNRAIEYTNELSSKLALHFDGDVITGDFLDHNVVNKYDGIVMNPPFGQGGKQAADHVRKAMNHLRDGGRIVALIPQGPAADKQFEKLLESKDAENIYTAAEIALPRVTFERAGTAISARVLVLEKQTDAKLASQIQQVNRDYTDAETIEDFFDRLEGSEIPERVAPITAGNAMVAAEEEAREADAERPAYGPGFVTMESVHTKKGHDLFVVNMTGDMGDDYQRYSEIAKANGGMYIRARFRNYYKPKDGGKVQGKPTFTFDSAGDRAMFLAEVQEAGLGGPPDNVAMAATAGRGMPVERVQAIADRLTGGKTALADIRVISSMDELTEAEQADMARQGVDRIAGLYNRSTGRITLVAAGLHTPKAVETTILHEVVGHRGIEGLLGDEFPRFLQLVDRARVRDKVVEDVYSLVEREYPNADAATKAAEVVAFLAEQQGTKYPLVQRIIQLIRKALRKLGFKVPFTSKDIIELLHEARNYVRSGEYGGGTGSGSLFQSAYHGSPHRFDRFSTMHIGSGEGTQAFGWGLYFAGKREVAEFYRDNLAVADVTWKGKSPNFHPDLNSYEAGAGMGMVRSHGDIDGAIWRAYRDLRPAVAMWLEKNRDHIEVSAGGSLYEVDVPEDHELMNWNVPMRDQPEGVKQKIAAALASDTGTSLSMALEQLNAETMTGEQWYRNESAHRAGADLGAPVRQSSNDKAMSLWLKEAGIPGHRFLDSGSRSATNKPPMMDFETWRDTTIVDDADAQAEYQEYVDQYNREGSYNYVIYDDERVSITETLFRAEDKPAPATMDRRKFMKVAAGTLAIAAGGAYRSTTPDITLGKASALSEAVTQDVDAKTERLLRAGSLIGALEQTAKTGPVELRRLASKLATLMPSDGVTVKVDDDGAWNVHGAVQKSSMGSAEMLLATAGDRTGLTYGTFLHESLHMVVMSRYASISTAAPSRNWELVGMTEPQAKEAIDQLVNLWREYGKQLRKNAGDPSKNAREAARTPDEFFVRALTDRAFQLELSAMRYQGKTLIKRFKDWVKVSLFGRSTGTAPSWLDAALVASNELIETMGMDRADFQYADMLMTFMGSQRENSIYDGVGQGDLFDDQPQRESAAAAKLTASEIAEWRQAHKVSQRQGRVPEVQAAAQDLEAGRLSPAQYRDVVKKYMPIMPIQEVPELTTTQDMSAALATNKAENILGVDREIKGGTRVASRLDIPAYDFYDTWVVTVHDGSVKSGNAIAYGAAAVMDNVEFATSPKAALGIATGSKAKSPFARIHGDWKDVTPEQARKMAQDAMSDPAWKQVGMNPFRHSYFYDKATGEPVVAADQVVQIGPLVMAKNVETASPESEQFQIKGTNVFFRVAEDGPDSREAMNRRMREEHHGLLYKAKNYAKRQLTPGGLLPRAVFEAKVKRDSDLGATELDVKSHVWALEEAFKRDFGKSIDRRTQEEERLMAAALAGEPDRSALPDATLLALESMRQYIDRHSERYGEILREDSLALLRELDPGRAEELLSMLATGEIDGLNQQEAKIVQKLMLMQTILGNVGRYVHRSYRVFDDAQWVRNVPDDILNAARDYLEGRYLEQYPEDGEEMAARSAQRVMESILKEDTAFDSFEGFIKESKLGAKDLSILQRRKDIAPEIRALMGEYEDPRLNFAKTATKMSRLIFNDLFLKKVREVGLGSFLFEEGQQPEGHWKKIAGDSSEVYAPLNGLMTTPEINQAFVDALGKENMAQWFRTIVQVNGMVKFGKTVLSPTTAARNWMSALFFALGNGHFNLAHTAKSIETVRSYFFHHPGSHLEYLRKLKQLGVVYDTPYAGEMMRLLDDTDIADKLTAGRVSKGLGVSHLLNFAQRFYQFGDDFWKIVGFENEVALQMKHMGHGREEAEQIAAERIRNTYPTYSMVGRGVNQLRRFPLAGTFVSFPAEIVRTSYGILKYAAEDMRANPALGARRLAGLAIISAAMYAAQELSRLILGVDDDEEEAVREQLPEWSQNSNLYFLSREGGKLRYIDLSFLDPYNYWKRPITAISRDKPVKDKAVSAARDMLTPFFGTDIAFGALAEVWMNKKSSGGRVYNEADTGAEQAADIANHLRKTLQPGAFSNAERILQAARGKRTTTGREYSMNDELAALAGFRISTLDPGVSLKYRAYEAQDNLRMASGILSRSARDPNPVTEEDLRATFDRVQFIRREIYDDLLKTVSAARRSGLSDAAIQRQLVSGGISKRDAAQMVRGRKPEWRPGPSYMRSLIRSSGDTFGDDVQQALKERRAWIMRWSRE